MRFKPVRFQNLQPDREPTSKPPIRGAGDLIARVAKPVARAIDRVFHTHLADCQSCEERRDWLNKL